MCPEVIRYFKFQVHNIKSKVPQHILVFVLIKILQTKTPFLSILLSVKFWNYKQVHSSDPRFARADHSKDFLARANPKLRSSYKCSVSLLVMQYQVRSSNPMSARADASRSLFARAHPSSARADRFLVSSLTDKSLLARESPCSARVNRLLSEPVQCRNYILLETFWLLLSSIPL